jgi:hypothetical protein
VYTSRRQVPLIVRSFLDFLAQRFGEQPEWDRQAGVAPLARVAADH